MQRKSVVQLILALFLGSAASAENVGCPKWERGARYPWQSNAVMRDDQFAWVILDVDRSGYPFRCRIGKNNYADNEQRFWLCKQYSDLWRGPPAKDSDPNTRRLERFSLIAGDRHVRADRKARKLWFKEHPAERPECYPEPSRPDRMDLGR